MPYVRLSLESGSVRPPPLRKTPLRRCPDGCVLAASRFSQQSPWALRTQNSHLAWWRHAAQHAASWASSVGAAALLPGLVLLVLGGSNRRCSSVSPMISTGLPPHVGEAGSAEFIAPDRSADVKHWSMSVYDKHTKH